MHAAILSAMLLAGADGYGLNGNSYAGGDGYAGGEAGDGCATCGGADCDGHAHRKYRHFSIRDDFGAMPQTCYSPRYGCYPGGDRLMHRYPAFHGSFYRRPYHYRNVFDYPWHAALHEPTSLFSYNVPADDQQEPNMLDIDPPPLPPSEAGAARRGRWMTVSDGAARQRAGRQKVITLTPQRAGTAPPPLR